MARAWGEESIRLCLRGMGGDEGIEIGVQGWGRSLEGGRRSDTRI